MSVEMTRATWAHLHELDDLVTLVPVDRRPRVERLKLVALYLADQYRERDGHVSESTRQICDATSINASTARNALRALDDLFWWKPIGKGNQHRATRRQPVFHLPVHAQVRPVNPDDPCMHRSDLSMHDFDGGPSKNRAMRILELKIEALANLETETKT